MGSSTLSVVSPQSTLCADLPESALSVEFVVGTEFPRGASNWTFTANGAARVNRFAVGSSSWNVTTAGIGLARRFATGTSSIAFSNSGIGLIRKFGSGVVSITSSTTGTAKAIKFASGESNWNFTTSGTGARIVASGVGSSEWTFTTSGDAFVRKSASGVSSITFTVDGTGGEVGGAKLGSGSTDWTFTNTATGKTKKFASGICSIAFTNTATASRTAYGIGTSSIVFTSTATGSKTGFGVGSSEWTFTTTSTGRIIKRATATSSWTFSNSGTGKATRLGTGVTSIAFSTTATGARKRFATATSTWAVSTTATGTKITGTKQGSGSSDWTFTSSATGKTKKFASGTSSIVFTNTATGRAIKQGAGISSITFTTTADGSTTSRDWIPTDGVAPTAWHDASDASTITESSNRVSQLDDKSGNGWHLEQATSADQPLTNSVTLNGLNGLFFDGVTEFMDTSSSMTALGTSDMTLFLVARIYSSGSTSNMCFMTASSDTTGITRGAGWKLSQRSNDDLRMSITDDTSSTDNTLSHNVFDATKAYMFSVSDERAGATSIDELRFVDGTQVTSTTKSGSAFGTLNLTGPLTWAANSNGTTDAFHYKVDLFESVYIIGDVDTTNRQLVEGYLAWKWGLEGDLPGGHPYSSAAPIYPDDA